MKRASLPVIALAFLAAGSGAQQPAPSRQPDAIQSAASSQEPSGVDASTPRHSEERRADVLVARKQYAEAADIYEKLLKHDPRNTILLNKTGITYHQQSLLGEAKRYYERAVKADRTNVNALNNIGTIYYQRKNYRKAIQLYNRALKIRTDMPVVHSNLGYAYFARRRYEEAMQAFHRALELDPGVFDRARGVGALLQDRSVADRGTFYFFLARSFAKLGNAERCAQYLRKARDEGYKGLAAARTDPNFASVLHDPGVAEVLQLSSPPAGQPRSTKPDSPGF